MGAYLDTPRTEKDTETGEMELNGKKGLPFAVSSMQGWRKTMEDAHIALPNLETQYEVPPGTSIYAVFDGHGGKEVSKFCARHFVEVLVELESFKARCYREALVECFHKIDDMILEPKYRTELDRFAGLTETMKAATEDSLFRNFNIDDGDDSIDSDKDSETGNFPENPPFLQTEDEKAADLEALELERKNSLYDEFGVNARVSGSSDDGAANHKTGDGKDDEDDVSSDGDGGLSEEELKELEDGEKLLAKRTESLNFSVTEKVNSEGILNDEKNKADDHDKDDNSSTGSDGSSGHKVLDELEHGENAAEQGENVPDNQGPVDIPTALSTEMSVAESKGSLTRTEALNIMLKVLRLTSKKEKGNANQDDEVNGRVTPPEPASRPPGMGPFDDTNKGLPTHAGTTACVALIIEGKIYVANAGDSRAVLCRQTAAEPLSYDHKPLHPRERGRIEAAGGWVTPMGRVCGNLNLSRCIGDLKYKLNEKIDRAEQIITAEPDVKSVSVEEEDLFMVVACDGVWDIMTNEGIIQYIGTKLGDKAKALTQIEASDELKATMTMQQTVEDIFTTCLCNDPMAAEGKGGDNMTCIIVCLRPLEEILAAF